MILDGETLIPEALAGVSRGGSLVELSAEGRRRNEATYRTTLKLLEGGDPVYGMNTGVGALKTVPIPPDLQEGHQRRLLRSHAVGTGDEVAPEIVRAMLAVRGNQIAAGGAGVHPELLDALVDALNAGLTPEIRELGSLGTSDLTSLAEAGLALIGERPFADGRRRSPVPLGPRDGLMLLGSNAHAIGEAALCCVDLSRLIQTSETCAAIAFEAVGANPTALDARVQAARPHPGQVAAAEHVRGLLEGYEPALLRLQDSYAFRCLPQVAGVLREAHDHLDRVLRVEMNSATENSLLFGDEALTTGNFHAAALAVALDHARNAISQAASLSAARLSALMNPEDQRPQPLPGREPRSRFGAHDLRVHRELGRRGAEAARHARRLAERGVHLSRGREPRQLRLSGRPPDHARDRFSGLHRRGGAGRRRPGVQDARRGPHRPGSKGCLRSLCTEAPRRHLR